MSDRLYLPLVLAMFFAASAALASVPDPMRPAIPMAADSTPDAPAAAALVLQSTVVSPRSRSAIINGRRYRLGETVGDARLAAIGAGWVRLDRPSGSTELRLSYSKPNPPVNR